MMNGSLLGLFGGSSSYDADARTYFNAVQAVGGIIQPEVKGAFSDLFTTLKSLNNSISGDSEFESIRELWFPIHDTNSLTILPALVKAKYPSGKSATLTNTSFDADDYSKAVGMKPNGNPGSAKKLTTDLIPTDLNSANMHYIFGGLDGVLDNTLDSRVSASGTGTNFSFRWNPHLQNMWYNIYLGTAVTLDTPSNFLFNIVNCTASNSLINYEAGLAKTTSSTSRAAFSDTTAVSLFSSGSASYYSGSQFFYSFGVAFDPLNIPEIDAAFKAVLTALGRTYKNILWEGDSITNGVGASNGNEYPNHAVYNLANAGLSLHSQFNSAVNGQTAATMDSNKVADLTPWLNSNSVFWLMAGVNDINNGSTGASTWTSISSILSYVAGLGVTDIFVCTITPMGSSVDAGKQAERVTLNDLIRNNASGVGATVVDVANAPEFVGGWSATYFADDFHPNNAGALVLGSIASTALSSVIN